MILLHEFGISPTNFLPIVIQVVFTEQIQYTFFAKKIHGALFPITANLVIATISLK